MKDLRWLPLWWWKLFWWYQWGWCQRYWSHGFEVVCIFGHTHDQLAQSIYIIIGKIEMWLPALKFNDSCKTIITNLFSKKEPTWQQKGFEEVENPSKIVIQVQHQMSINYEEISSLHVLLDEMSKMMKELFGQLNSITSIRQQQTCSQSKKILIHLLGQEELRKWWAYSFI